MKTLFTKSQVENLLPQKEPFAMVETLLEKENELFSTLMISADNLLVEQGCFSEAGLLEFMAQSIAVFSAYHSTEQEKEAQERQDEVISFLSNAIKLSPSSIKKNGGPSPLTSSPTLEQQSPQNRQQSSPPPAPESSSRTRRGRKYRG